MKFIYYLIFTSWYVFSLLPLKFLYLVSDLLYFPLYYIVKYRRNVVRENLVSSFPEKSETEIVKIEKEFYHFFCDYIMETVKLFSMSKEEMMRRMTFTGIDEMRELLQKEGKKSCFVYLGHYCNWEFVASLQYWLPDMHCGQIYHPLYNKDFDRLFLWLRGKFGGESIPMKETMRRLITLNKEEKISVIGFISDQSPKWEGMGHWIEFLHHETAFFQGTERIGRKLDAAIYYLEVKRVKRGYYTAHFKCVTLHPSEMPEHAITDCYSKLLEMQIQESPAYWLWSHKRWKRTKEQWMQWKKDKDKLNHIS